MTDPRKTEYSVVVDRIIYEGEPVSSALATTVDALTLALAVLDQAGLLEEGQQGSLLEQIRRLADLETEIDHNEGASVCHACGWRLP